MLKDTPIISHQNINEYERAKSVAYLDVDVNLKPEDPANLIKTRATRQKEFKTGIHKKTEQIIRELAARRRTYTKRKEL